MKALRQDQNGNPSNLSLHFQTYKHFLLTHCDCDMYRTYNIKLTINSVRLTSHMQDLQDCQIVVSVDNIIEQPYGLNTKHILCYLPNNQVTVTISEKQGKAPTFTEQREVVLWSSLSLSFRNISWKKFTLPRTFQVIKAKSEYTPSKSYSISFLI